MLKNLFGKGKDAAKALEAYNTKVDEHNALTEEKDHLEHRTAENMPTEDEAETLDALVAELDGSAEKAAAEAKAKEEADAKAKADAEAKGDEVKADKAGKGMGAKKYEKPVAKKYTPYKGKEAATAEKEDGKWIGMGLVDFETNGKYQPLGKEGKVWSMPAERAQGLVDKGMGEILGETKIEKKKKK